MYPKTVPILRSQDICRNNRFVASQRPLNVWISATFYKRERICVTHLINEKLPVKYKNNLSKFNDDKYVSKDRIAKIWNDTITQLGYTEIIYVWPESVPILRASNIHKGSGSDPFRTDKHCLLKWVDVVFGQFLSLAEKNTVIDALQQVINDKRGIIAFNDDAKNSERKIAMAWNRTMKELGYTEIFNENN